jgi:serine/threonine protein kinase
MKKNIVKYTDTKSIADIEGLLESFDLEKYTDIKKFIKDKSFKVIETEKKIDDIVGYTIGNGDVTFFVKKEKYNPELLEMFSIFNKDKSWGIAPFVPYLYYSNSLKADKLNNYYCFYETFSLNFLELSIIESHEPRIILEVVITVLIALLYLYDKKIVHNDLHVKNVMINIGQDMVENVYATGDHVFKLKTKYKNIVINDFGLAYIMKHNNINDTKKVYDSFLSRFYYIDFLRIVHDESIYERVYYIDLWRFLSSTLSIIKNNLSDELMQTFTLLSKYNDIVTKILLYESMYDYKSVVSSIIYELIFIHNPYSFYDNIANTYQYQF